MVENKNKILEDLLYTIRNIVDDYGDLILKGKKREAEVLEDLIDDLRKKINSL